MVGLFDPLSTAPDDRALAGGLLGAPKRQRRPIRSCFGPCSSVLLMREDGTASGALRADGAAPDEPVAALLCVQCAADYAERADTLGCARCGGALRIGVPIEGHDVEGLCAPCAVGVAAAAAAKAAAAPLLLAPGAARRDRGRRRPTEHGRQDHGARQALSGVRLLRRGAGRGVRPVHGSRERGVGDEEGRRLPHCSANVCCLAFTAWRDQRWGSLDELPQPASSLNRNEQRCALFYCTVRPPRG